MNDFLGLIRYALSHPVGKRQPLRTLIRILKWQILSRVGKTPRECQWVGGARLSVARGMTGATGNLYFGLWEFADMAFFLHLLRPHDHFLDIGANVGTFSVLASRVCGAQTWAFEPDVRTADLLKTNLRANAIEDKVTIFQCALGESEGEIGFTVGLGPTNRVATESDVAQQKVPIKTLDTLLLGQSPVAAKLDVEGFELEVLKGAGKTMAQASLLAIQIETVLPEAHAALVSKGFEQYYYDPFGRTLSREPNGLSANNALYLRDVEKVKIRLETAPKYDIFGLLV
jgi:FkbM family methyltransferase